jgi:hypothetical protein
MDGGGSFGSLDLLLFFFVCTPREPIVIYVHSFEECASWEQTRAIT